MQNQNFNAGAYNLIKTLRDRFYLNNHEASYMRKTDIEKAQLMAQEYIERMLGRELADLEISDLDKE